MISEFDPNEEFEGFPEELWQYVYTRDNGICQITGGGGSQEHHILHKSHGGKNCANNLILLSKRGHDIQHGKDRLTGPIRKKVLKEKVRKNEERLRRSLV